MITRHPWALMSLAGLLVFSILNPADACMFRRWRAAQATTTVSQYVPACTTCGVPTPVVAMSAPPVVPAAPIMAAAPACGCGPVAVQETRMVQRCYLAPVTTMQQQTQYENVTTLRTEFYDEAVTTMQTSAYYDPCQCGYKAVQTPVTTMVRRARQVPVTQTIARNYMVPVTTYEQRCTAEPVTETKLYYPATPAVAVPAPVTAAYVTPAPVAVAAPVPAVASAGYFAPAAPAPGIVPAPPQGAAAPPGNQPNNQFYQDPNAGQSSNGTWVIERTVQNGQVIQENRKLVRPGEQIPPANPPVAPKEETPAPTGSPETPGSSGWQPAPLKTIPVSHTSTARLSSKVEPTSVAAAEYHR